MKKVVVIWIALAIGYSVLTYTRIISPLFLPKPHEVLLAVRVLWTPIGFSKLTATQHLAITMWKFILASLIGGIIGIPLGFAKAYLKDLDRTIDPILNIFRAIPVTNLFSIFMLIFGYGPQTHIAMSIFRGVLDHAVGSEEGVRNCRQDVIEAAMLDGADTWQIVRYITAYLALPYIFATAKASLSIAFVIVSVGEQMAGSVGIGAYIRDRYMSYDIPEMWVGIILSGVVGMLVNYLLNRLRSFLITWE